VNKQNWKILTDNDLTIITSKQSNNKLSPSWHQTRSEIGDKSVPAISSCFASKTCVHNQITNWQQKPSFM